MEKERIHHVKFSFATASRNSSFRWKGPKANRKGETLKIEMGDMVINIIFKNNLMICFNGKEKLIVEIQ